MVRPILRNVPSIGAYGSILVVAGGGAALFSVWSDIREIGAQPAMSDNGAEVVHLSVP